jgi:hypothetical protein
MPHATSTIKVGRHHILLFNKNEKVTKSFPKSTYVLDVKSFSLTTQVGCN